MTSNEKTAAAEGPAHNETVPDAAVEATELDDQLQDIKYSPWTRHMFRLYGCLLVGYFGATTNGYDGSVMGALNAMNSYLSYFHMESASASTGLVFAIYNLGTVGAIPFVGPANDHLGRRGGMFVGALTVVLGSLISALAKDHGMFMAGRFVLGFGVAFCNISSPVYVGEMAHPQWRGVQMGLYNCFYFVGSITASWVTYAAQYRGPGGWRIPLYCQLIASGIVASSVWFLPESPRWLIAQGRPEAAREVLSEYHGEGNPDHPLVKLEMAEMEYQIMTDASDKRWWDYRELINTRARRRRLLSILTMAVFAQLSGNAVTSYYLPVMLESAGITSQQRKLMLNGIYNVLSFIVALFGAALMDRVGRRKQAMYSLVAIITCFTILTPLSKYAKEQTSNSALANTTIAFIYLSGFTYSIGWTPISPMYIVENLETSTRAKGKSVAQFFTACASFTMSYGSAPAFGKIAQYYYLVFIGWDLLELVVIYFWWPETRGRTLEEIEEVYSAPDPVKKSLEPRSTQTIANTIAPGTDEKGALHV